MGDKTRGLYPEGKFIVSRRDGTDKAGDKHDGCRYFVLDITHDPHAVPALRSYAASARKDGYELLANDLERAVGNAASALASRDAEIRAVLEGLGKSTGDTWCWCSKPARDGNGSLIHFAACLAARALWEKVQER